MISNFRSIKKLLLGLSIGLLFLNGCEYPKCSNSPGALRLRLISKSDSTDLISNGFYNKDSITIWYVNQNQKTSVSFQVKTDSNTEKSVIESNDIGWKSTEGYKTFYIHLNSSDTDTLYLDVTKISGEKCTSYQYTTFKYNGQEIVLDTKEYNYIIKK